ncbi:hypothetical protein KGP36_02535 [Patescibacteria group bacterium]|nr:hypothetical protein [Patescibacteria group bacterium]
MTTKPSEIPKDEEFMLLKTVLIFITEYVLPAYFFGSVAFLLWVIYHRIFH